MSVTDGPNLHKMINAATGDQFAGDFRSFLQMIDVLVQCAVISKTLTAPPGSPANGDRYIVGPSPTGGWAGQANKITVWTTDNPGFPSGFWDYFPPNAGFLVFNVADSTFYSYTGSAWAALPTLPITEANVTGLVADLAATEKTANKAAASGYASLDGSSKVPTAQIPDIAESGVTGLVADLAAKAPLASPAFSGTVTSSGVISQSLAEPIISMSSSAGGGKNWKIISGGGAEVGVGIFALQNTTDSKNVIRIQASTVADAIYADGDGMTIQSLKVNVIATASLPAAGSTQDGRVVIEDAGSGDRNFIIYAGGQRFRIDGGTAF